MFVGGLDVFSSVKADGVVSGMERKLNPELYSLESLCERGQRWFKQSGAMNKMLKSNRSYNDYKAIATTVPTPQQILLDIERTLPDVYSDQPVTQSFMLNCLASNGKSVDDSRNELLTVLRTFVSAFNYPGYSQGMNFIVYLLLLFMDEEHTFWTLATIVQDMKVPDFYESVQCTGLLVDSAVLTELCVLRLRPLIAAVGEQTLQLYVQLLTPKCMISLTLPLLPIETSLAVWDVYFARPSLGLETYVVPASAPSQLFPPGMHTADGESLEPAPSGRDDKGFEEKALPPGFDLHHCDEVMFRLIMALLDIYYRKEIRDDRRRGVLAICSLGSPSDDEGSEGSTSESGAGTPKKTHDDSAAVLSGDKEILRIVEEQARDSTKRAEATKTQSSNDATANTSTTDTSSDRSVEESEGSTPNGSRKADSVSSAGSRGGNRGGTAPVPRPKRRPKQKDDEAIGKKDAAETSAPPADETNNTVETSEVPDIAALWTGLMCVIQETPTEDVLARMADPKFALSNKELDRMRERRRKIFMHKLRSKTRVLGALRAFTFAQAREMITCFRLIRTGCNDVAAELRQLRILQVPETDGKKGDVAPTGGPSEFTEPMSPHQLCSIRGVSDFSVTLAQFVDILEQVGASDDILPRNYVRGQSRASNEDDKQAGATPKNGATGSVNPFLDTSNKELAGGASSPKEFPASESLRSPAASNYSRSPSGSQSSAEVIEGIVSQRNQRGGSKGTSVENEKIGNAHAAPPPRQFRGGTGTMSPAEQLFAIADQDPSGSADFRDLMTLLAMHMQKNASFEERLTVCFAMNDIDGDGVLASGEAKFLISFLQNVALGLPLPPREHILLDTAHQASDHKAAAEERPLSGSTGSKLSFDECFELIKNEPILRTSLSLNRADFSGTSESGIYTSNIPRVARCGGCGAADQECSLM